MDGIGCALVQGGAGGEHDAFERKEVIAEILAGMGDDRDARGGVEEFYTKHGLILPAACSLNLCINSRVRRLLS